MPEDDNAAPQAKRRGRPASESGGRGSVLTVTMNPRTRARLEAVAQSNGRSLSAQVEEAILLGSIVSGLDEVGVEAADTLTAMVKFAVAVRREYGDPARSLHARNVLREGWKMLAGGAVPYVRSSSDSAQVVDHLRALAIRAADAIAEDGGSGEAIQIMHRLANAKLHGGSPDWADAINLLEVEADKGSRTVGSYLTVVTDQMKAAYAAVVAEANSMGDPTHDARQLLLSLGHVAA